MFKIFKKKVYELYSPVIGKSILLEQVNDKVFAEKMMGDGLAFEFQGDSIYAPCSAKVVMIANTKHAIGLQNGDIEILIHVGLDTVNLNGIGLTSHVKTGSTVKRGDVLLTIDRKLMDEKQIDLTTPMIITSQGKKLEISDPDFVDLNAKVIKIT